MIDRLVHYSYPMLFDGQSYRIKNSLTRDHSKNSPVDAAKRVRDNRDKALAKHRQSLAVAHGSVDWIRLLGISLKLGAHVVTCYSGYSHHQVGFSSFRFATFPELATDFRSEAPYLRNRFIQGFGEQVRIIFDDLARRGAMVSSDFPSGTLKRGHGMMNYSCQVRRRASR